MAAAYSVRELYNIGRAIGRNSRINNVVFSRLRAFNICQVVRGCRAGACKQRPIETVISQKRHLMNHSKLHANGINVNNCIVLKADKDLLGDHRCNKQFPITSVALDCCRKDDTHEIKNGVNVNNLAKLNKQSRFGNKLTVCCINARSVKNKADQVTEYMLDQDADLCAITETWLSKSDFDKTVRANLTPTGYSLIDVPRAAGRGGGVAVVHKASLKVKQLKVKKKLSFECMEILVTGSSYIVRLMVVYRPPSSGKSGKSTQVFLNEFQEYLDQNTTTSGKLICVGDFNFHYDDAMNADAQKFKELIHGYNMEQHVPEPTHTQGHILDLVITRNADIPILDLQVQAPLLSDHSPVMFRLPIGKPRATRKTCTFRKTKDIDIMEFKNDIQKSSLLISPADDVNLLVNQYNKELSSILDEHAPLQQKQIVIRPNCPWITNEIKKEKKSRRIAERKWRSSKLNVHLEIFRNAQRNVVKLCSKAKSAYYCSQIADCGKDQKQLFHIVNGLLKRGKSNSLPTHTESEELANQFADYFTGKIQKIRGQFPVEQIPMSYQNKLNSVPQLDKLQLTTEEELEKMILSSKTKTCMLDPIPTTILRASLDVLLPTLCKIVNLSLSTSTFPEALKEAAVTPLIKKASLDVENLKNYRPVSNVAYVGKLVEKAAITRLSSHILHHGLDEPLQSAYRPQHSVETALVKVYNDMLLALDSRKGVMLVLLDLSAAFDTVEPEILTHRLELLYGITGEALLWVKSYFENRRQFVNIDGKHSRKHPLDSLPQGSLFGPFSFPKYTSPIGRICEKYDVCYHLYADDTQVYVEFDKNSAVEAKDRLERCIDEIRLWLAINRLKLNEEKTEYVVVGSKQFQKSVSEVVSTVMVGGAVIGATQSARNIGAIVDSHLDMGEHVTALTRSCYLHLRNMGKIRQYLTQDATVSLVHAFVSSKLDNLNGLLSKSNSYILDRLQLIQNQAARLVMRIKVRDRLHMTPVLENLHWLPVKFRVSYKICLLVYKCLHGMAPLYLSSLLKSYKPGRELRSSTQDLIQTNGPKRVGKYGERAFSVCAPHLWNALPEEVRKAKCIDTFKSKLKTHLFQVAFEL
jgi:exonuclease III